MAVAISRRLPGQGAPRGDHVGPNPTDRVPAKFPELCGILDRGKAGTKRSHLVDGDGGPLSVVVAGANVNGHKLLRPTIEAVVVERPDCEQHLCLDKAYDNAVGECEALYSPGPRSGATSPISDASEKRSSTGRARKPCLPVAGWSRGPSPGSQSAAACWSATRRRHATTSVSYSPPACSSGSGATTG